VSALEETPAVRVPVLYVTDLRYNAFDPADLFDLAFLLRSPRHELRGVCLSEPASDGDLILDALSVRTRQNIPLVRGADGFAAALRDAPEPLNVAVVAGFGAVAAILALDRALFREKVGRLFLVGGHANDYALMPFSPLLPIDPRLRDRHPERFAVSGDTRIGSSDAEQAAFETLLTSGESVIWLPRDISLWRYAAPGVLADGGETTEFLLRELFYFHLENTPDRYDAADAPVLLSALPAFLLALQPDPFAWMRLFRVVTARVATNEKGRVTAIATRTDTPNLYAVIAIDSQALGKLLTANLRDRPLPTTAAL